MSIMSISNQIQRYLDALKSYNEHTNVYSTHAYDRLDFHVQDCLSLADLIGNDPVRVLDIGSGHGHHVKEFSKKGVKVKGIDKSQAMVKRAKKTYPRFFL